MFDEACNKNVSSFGFDADAENEDNVWTNDVQGEEGSELSPEDEEFVDSFKNIASQLLWSSAKNSDDPWGSMTTAPPATPPKVTGGWASFSNDEDNFADFDSHFADFTAATIAGSNETFAQNLFKRPQATKTVDQIDAKNCEENERNVPDNSFEDSLDEITTYPNKSESDLKPTESENQVPSEDKILIENDTNSFGINGSHESDEDSREKTSPTEPTSDLPLKSAAACTPKEQLETGSPTDNLPTSVESSPTVPIVENGSA